MFIIQYYLNLMHFECHHNSMLKIYHICHKVLQKKYHYQVQKQSDIRSIALMTAIERFLQLYVPLEDYFSIIKEYPTVSNNYSKCPISDLWLFLPCEKYTIKFVRVKGITSVLKSVFLSYTYFVHLCGRFIYLY